MGREAGQLASRASKEIGPPQKAAALTRASSNRIVRPQTFDDVAIHSVQASSFLYLRFPPPDMATAGVVGTKIRPPAAWAFCPSVSDPLRRYPEPPETVIAMAKFRRMDYAIMGRQIGLRFPATVELTEFFGGHCRPPSQLAVVQPQSKLPAAHHSLSILIVVVVAFLFSAHQASPTKIPRDRARVCLDVEEGVPAAYRP
jgi:hypothetical protein